MQHQGNQSRQNFEWFRRGDDGGRNEQMLSGTGCNIRPDKAVPPTVLVTNLGDGSLVLQSWRDGPTAYLNPAEAVPLRRVLSAIFANTALVLATRQDNTR